MLFVCASAHTDYQKHIDLLKIDRGRQIASEQIPSEQTSGGGERSERKKQEEARLRDCFGDLFLPKCSKVFLSLSLFLSSQPSCLIPCNSSNQSCSFSYATFLQHVNASLFLFILLYSLSHKGWFWKICQLVPQAFASFTSRTLNYCSINSPERDEETKVVLKVRRDLHPSTDERWKKKRIEKNERREVSLTIFVAFDALELLFTFQPKRKKERSEQIHRKEIYFLDMTHWVESHAISWMCYCYFHWRWKCWTFHIQWDLLCVTVEGK